MNLSGWSKKLQEQTLSNIKSGQDTLTKATNSLKQTANSSSKYINHSIKHTSKTSQKYIAEKTKAATIEGQRLAYESLKQTSHFAKEQNEHFWRIINFKNRSLSLIKGTFSLFRKTKAYRFSRNLAILGTIGNAAYVYGTRFEKDITVSRTFNQLKETNGQVKNQYFVADDQRKLYQVKSSLWYLQWWPDELWADIKEGEQYHVMGWGWRIHKFRLHPRIVSAIRINPEAVDLDEYE